MGKESRAPPRTPPSAFFYTDTDNIIIFESSPRPLYYQYIFWENYHTIVFKPLCSYGIIELICCSRYDKMKQLARLLIGTALLCSAVVLSLAALSCNDVHAPRQNQVPTTIVVEQTTEQPEWHRYEVFVTNYGTKYHRAGCHYLRQSCYSIALINAINGGYTACSYCHPPLPEASGEG